MNQRIPLYHVLRMSHKIGITCSNSSLENKNYKTENPKFVQNTATAAYSFIKITARSFLDYHYEL